jgi:hypothetical protein
MSLGDVGFGFDFLIDPYRHGGQPAAVTSVPYPLTPSEEFDARVEHAFDITLLQNLEELDVTSVALSGTMRDILKKYTETEAIDSIMPVAQSGSMAAILKRGYGDEEFNSTMAVALNGEMRRILIVITMETDSFNGVTAVATGGTMN